jgi:dihydrofolate reductase
MKPIIVTAFVSLDGVGESPEKWSLKFWNDEIAKFKNDELFAADALLLGRVTYEGFAASWPLREGDAYTDRMNSMPKFVVSSTLQSANWNNSTLIRSDTVTEIAKLKQQQTLLVFGSMTLVQTLMQHGLADEYRLLVYPIVLGGGKRVFKDGSSATLKRTEVKPHGPEVVLLRYRP